MAALESVQLTRLAVVLGAGEVIKSPVLNKRQALPQLFWADHRPWREANVWLLEHAGSKDQATVIFEAKCLLSYAGWLEGAKVDWLHFPAERAFSCLGQYRSHLISCRNDSRLAPSTATARMRTVVSFYRWLSKNGYAPETRSMWRDRSVTIRRRDDVGFKQSLHVATTNLAIPNRSAPGMRLEGGVQPISLELRDSIIRLARDSGSTELHLLLSLGFMSGMRLGSICDLKVQTIFSATQDPITPGISYLTIGPGSKPTVRTKYGVTGRVLLPTGLLSMLKDYCYSPRRLRREIRAERDSRDLVFLTRSGNSYQSAPSSSSSGAVNVAIHRLRHLGMSQGLDIGSFRFHQTRATFATYLTQLALQSGNETSAISFVRGLLLHKDEATTLRYIRLARIARTKQALSNQFTRLLLGLVSESDEPT